MPQSPSSTSNPYGIIISGFVGSGESTPATALARQLQAADTTQDLRTVFAGRGSYIGVDLEDGPRVDLGFDRRTGRWYVRAVARPHEPRA